LTDGLLLDTHIALWLENGHERLRPATLGLIESCWRGGGLIYLSAVVVWEIAVLVNAGRLRSHIPIEQWVDKFLARPGVEPAPLGHRAAARSYQFPELEHRDPADRLLIATAIELGCPLVTYDSRIRRFGERYGEQYGFAVAT
jgi:PIN domain nuclease of toxin-antitoxin system